jgi:hypothetical protein
MSAVATAPPPGTQDHPARSRALPLAGIAAGAIAIGAGVVLLSLDGDGTCSHAAGDLCERSYRTKGGGIALTSIGVVAAALGVTFLVGHF